MDPRELLTWWNLIFLLPLAVAVIYIGVYSFSGIAFGEADVDADVDADAHAEVDADADGDADAGADAHGDLHHEPALYLLALSWLGMGKVPMSLLLTLLMATWGGIGMLVNAIVQPLMPVDAMAALVSLPVAGIGSALLTRGASRLLKRYMPTHETYARKREALVGLTGEAVFDINQTFGLVSVRDSQGDLYQVPCRVGPDRPTIPRATRVLLVDYEEREGVFIVRPYELEKNATPSAEPPQALPPQAAVTEQTLPAAGDGRLKQPQ